MSARRFKPYLAYKDSGVEWLGGIPAHWVSLALSRVTLSKCDGPFGSGLKSEHYSADGVRVIRLQNIGSTEFLDTDRAFIPEGYAKELGDHSVIADDLLIAGLGDEGHPVGRACVAPQGIDPAMVKADCFRFRTDHRRVIPPFAAYQLSGTALAAAASLATGATRSRMNLTTTASRKLALPSPDEQRAIAAFLDRETARIDALVAKKRRLIELLQEQRTALITRAVTKGLDPHVPMKDSGVEWLGEIPAHWEVKRVKNLSRFVTSGSRGWAEHYTDEGSLFLRIGNLRTGSIDLDLADVQHVSPPQGAEGERTRVCSGDLLISITALIGAVGVVPEGVTAAFVNQHLALVRLSDKRVLARWLGYCVLSRVGQEQLRAELYGGTKDGLSLDDIRSLIVLVPPREEQRRIVEILDDAGSHVDALIAKIRHVIDRLKELRTALISAAVTGKIDVREEAA